MGVNQSKANISKPITLNRIRTECQIDPSVPHDLKQYYADLLANDLNALGFDIAIENNGRKRSPTDICRDIRHATLPDVEAICMSGSDRKGKETEHVIKLVNHFNKYYGARIPILSNPANPKSSKRSVYDMCEDLYLVADKMQTKLTDHPKVVKDKLQAMIEELEYKKNQIQGQFGSLMTSLQRAKNDDKMEDKLKVARSMQNAMNAALDNQVSTATNGFSTLISELKQTVESNKDGPTSLGSGLQGLSGTSPGMGGNQALNQLSLLRDGNTEKNKERISLLMQAMREIDSKASGCTNCLNKYGMSLAEYNNIKGDTAKLSDRLQKEFKKQFINVDPKNKAAVNSILSCYNSLLNDQAMCSNERGFNLTTDSVPFKGNDLAMAFSTPENVAALVTEGLRSRKQTGQPTAIAMASGNV